MGAVMEVRPGYKQTEVGVIPEDWEVVRLGESRSLSNGSSSALPSADVDGRLVFPFVDPTHA